MTRHSSLLSLATLCSAILAVGCAQTAKPPPPASGRDASTRTASDAGVNDGAVTVDVTLAPGADASVDVPRVPDGGMVVTSTAFTNGQPIPPRFVFRKGNVQPQVSWSGAPAETVSFVIYMYDMDARTFVHWIVFNIPPDTRMIAEGDNTVGLLGTNGFDEIGWSGPAPEPGDPHHYTFKVYAMDRTFALPRGTPDRTLRTMLTGHVLAEGTLIGTYQNVRNP